MTRPAHAPKSDAAERGVVLPVLLIMFLGFGAIAYGGLTMTIAENQKGLRRFHALQAQAMAEGELEVAKNLVNASPYGVNLQNVVLRRAIDEPNQLIDGTQVRVEQVGTSNYFRLTASANHVGVTRTAEAVVRESSPVSAFNLFVIDHPVGISGAPRGAIHTNRWVDFYFPDGRYQDSVTAVEGFRYQAGATPENTRLTGTTNPNAARSNVLDSVDFPALWSRADVAAVTESDLVAEIEFRGEHAVIDLYRPAHYETQTRIRERQVLSGYEEVSYVDSVPMYQDVPYTVTEPVYESQQYVENVSEPVYAWRDVTKTVTENVYEDRTVEYTVEIPIYATRLVSREVQKYVWIGYGTTSGGVSSSGGTVASSGDGSGYWALRTVVEQVEERYVSGYETETRTRVERVKVGTRTYDKVVTERYVDYYRTVPVTRTRQVQVGEQEVVRIRKDLIGYDEVTRTRQVPVYDTVTESYEVQVLVEEQFVRTETASTRGVAYIAGDVRSLRGTLNGRLSLIVGGKVRITDDVVYVDDEGRTRMLNGSDPTQPYEQNPEYDGDSLLAVLAKDDIVYAADGPSNLEVNASLVSTEGSVGFEGIVTSEDGTDVWTELPTGGNHVRDSLRRLGGIVSRRRPVATYIDDRGYITAGYERGESIMDANLVLSAANNAPPPFMFEAGQPTWVISASGRRLGAID